MIVTPRIRGFICTTAHPTGCYENVKQQIKTVTDKGAFDGAKKVLVLGCSTGYGLSTRISAAFGGGADTLGVSFERPSNGKRTASAGFYNNVAMDKLATAQGMYSKTLLGDAFSAEMKSQVVDTIKADLGQVDMIVYSLASPRRTLADGTTVSSTLKTTGAEYTNKTINLSDNTVSTVTIPSATEEEVANTVTVMGGEDWAEWIQVLSDANVIAKDAITLAYSYIGPSMTHPIYRDGSIGQAKKHLHQTATDLTAQYQAIGLSAYISVNKALVTQASAAIPIVPLYISLLYKVMKEQNVHEGCIEQMDRMLRDKIFAGDVQVDDHGMIRMDDLEMSDPVQQAVAVAWDAVTTENIAEYADLDGYQQDFRQMFGFDLPQVDYSADVEI